MKRLSIVERSNQEIQLKEYWNSIEDRYGIDNGRSRRNVIYRHAFSVAAREASGLSTTQLGAILKRDHATILHAERSHDGNYRFDRLYNSIYTQILADLKEIIGSSNDFYGSFDLSDESKGLRDRLMNLSRRNRELISERNGLAQKIQEMESADKTLKIRLRDLEKRNQFLNKKLSSVAWE